MSRQVSEKEMNLMRKSPILVFALLAICLGASPTQASPAGGREILDQFLADHPKLVKIPVSGENFYTICSTYGGEFVAGYEGGKCVAFALDGQGRVEYAPLKIREIKVGIATGATAHLAALHRILGAHSLADISGAYVYLASGAAVVGGAQVTYFTKKIAWNGMGDSPDVDASWGGIEGNLITLGVLWYTRLSEIPHRYSLSRTQLRAIDAAWLLRKDRARPGTVSSFDGGGSIFTCDTGYPGILKDLEISGASDPDVVCRHLTKSPKAIAISIEESTFSGSEGWNEDAALYHSDGSITLIADNNGRAIRLMTSATCKVVTDR
jgi:hypothetical protein